MANINLQACPMHACDGTDLLEIFRSNTREVETMGSKEEESYQREDPCDVKPMTRHGFCRDLDPFPRFPLSKGIKKKKEKKNLLY